MPWVVKNNNEYTVKKNHVYYCQVQLGMFVSNVTECDFIIYSSFDDTCSIMRIKYDSALITEHIPKLKFIYFHYMLGCIVKYFEEKEDKKAKSIKNKNHQVLMDITNK